RHGYVGRHQRRVNRALVRDAGGVQVLQGRDEFQFDIPEQAAEGDQDVRAEAQAQRVRRYAAHSPDEQGDEQPHSQEEELEDDGAEEQEEKRLGVVVAAIPEERDADEAADRQDEARDDEGGQGGQQFACQDLARADRLSEQEVRRPR